MPLVDEMYKKVALHFFLFNLFNVHVTIHVSGISALFTCRGRGGILWPPPAEVVQIVLSPQTSEFKSPMDVGFGTRLKVCHSGSIVLAR